MVLNPLPQCRAASPSRELAEENGRFLPPSNTFTSDEKTWRNASLLSVTQISDSGLRPLHLTSLEMRELVKEGGDGIGRGRGGDDRLKHRILASIFFEPSTRTSCSFRAAMTRLGGTTLHLDCGGGKSGGGNDKTSTAKGESLSDTVRSLECYTDITVLRHPIEGSVATVAAAKASNHFFYKIISSSRLSLPHLPSYRNFENFVKSHSNFPFLYGLEFILFLEIVR